MACKPGSVPFRAMIIPLGRLLPDASSNLPGQRPGKAGICHPYLVLLPVGFALPSPLPGLRCALTAPFHPYLRAPRGGISAVRFCGTVPGVTPGGCYPSPYLPWSPDFPLAAFDGGKRPSGHLTGPLCLPPSPPASANSGFYQQRFLNSGRRCKSGIRRRQRMQRGRIEQRDWAIRSGNQQRQFGAAQNDTFRPPGHHIRDDAAAAIL